MHAESGPETLDTSGYFLQLPPELSRGGGCRLHSSPSQSAEGGLEFRVALELREELKRLENQHALLLSFLQEGLPRQLAAQLKDIWVRCEAHIGTSQVSLEKRIQEDQEALENLKSRLDESLVSLTARCLAKTEYTADIAAVKDTVKVAESRAIQKSAESLEIKLQEAVDGLHKHIAGLAGEVRNECKTKLSSGITEIDSRISFELQTWDTRLTAVEEEVADLCGSCKTIQEDLKSMDTQYKGWQSEHVAASKQRAAEEEAQRKQAIRALARGLSDEASSREEGDVIVSKAIRDARSAIEERIDALENQLKVDHSVVGDLERWRQDEVVEVKRLSQELIAQRKLASSEHLAAEERMAKALDEIHVDLEEQGHERDVALESLEGRLKEISENAVTSSTALLKDLTELGAKAQSDLVAVGKQCTEQALHFTESRESELRMELGMELSTLRAGLTETEAECAQLRLLSNGPINFVWSIDAFEETSRALGVYSGKYIESSSFRLRASEGLTLRLYPYGKLQSRPGNAALAVYQKRRHVNPFEASAQPTLRVLLRAAGVEAGPFELLAWDDMFDVAGTENFTTFDVLQNATTAGSLRIEVTVPI